MFITTTRTLNVYIIWKALIILGQTSKWKRKLHSRKSLNRDLKILWLKNVKMKIYEKSSLLINLRLKILMSIILMFIIILHETSFEQMNTISLLKIHEIPEPFKKIWFDRFLLSSNKMFLLLLKSDLKLNKRLCLKLKTFWIMLISDRIPTT